MTIDEILDLPPNALEKMTVEELTKHLEPCFPKTRPEQVAKTLPNGVSKIDPALKAGIAQAQAALGIDLSYLLKKGKR
jgi:hypothetical protein